METTSKMNIYLSEKFQDVGFQMFSGFPSSDGETMGLFVTFISMEPVRRELHTLIYVNPFFSLDPEKPESMHVTATIKPYRPGDLIPDEREDMDVLEEMALEEMKDFLRSWLKTYHYTKKSKEFFEALNTPAFLDQFQEMYTERMKWTWKHPGMNPEFLKRVQGLKFDSIKIER